METCGSTNYWARKFQGFGHEVKLMSPQFVKPYVKTKKMINDAEAICEAVTRHNMRGSSKIVDVPMHLFNMLYLLEISGF